MRLKFWGVRGSITNPLTPAAYENKLRSVIDLYRSEGNGRKAEDFLKDIPKNLNTTFGGNTSCVTVSESGKLLILDAGTGIKNLASEILRGDFPKPDNDEYNIILSHLHLDHINGLPFFTPVHFKNTKINFFSGHKNFKKYLEMQQNFNFFPVSLETRPSEKKFIKYSESEPIDFGTMKVNFKRLNHPNSAFTVRITSASGKSIVYATDGEYTAKASLNDYFDFYRDADILIFDSQYSFNQLAERYSFGHSTPEVGIDAAVNSNVSKLYLFHHDHCNDDEMIERSYLSALKYKNEKYPSSKLEIFIANEGTETTI